MSKSLTDKTISGLNWNFLKNYSNTISTLIVGIILARLLSPQEFGLVGMITIFTGFADLFATLGMGQSIIRVKNINENHIRVATTLSITASIIIYISFYFLTPLIVDFYKEPRLTPIIRVISTLFIIRGINTVSYGQLSKNLDFKSITYIHVFTNIAYGIASSILAIIGFGVWSLVYSRIVSASLAMILTTRKYPVNFKPLIKKKEFMELAGFGAGVSLSKILLYGSSNIDYLIIGKMANPFSLGLYTKAFNLMTNSIDKISGGMSTVLFPAFALVQNEKEKLRKAYFRSIKTAAFFIIPILGSMIVTGNYIIKGLYGIKWAGAVGVFQILALGGILRSTLVFSGTIAHATGRVFAEASQQLVYLLILGICAFYGIRFGIEGVAFAAVIALIWMFIAQSYLAIKIIESSWKDFFKCFIPASANLMIMVFVNLIIVFIIENYLNINSYEIKLLIIVMINIPSFLAVIIFVPFKIKGDTFDWILEKYRKYIPKKFVEFYLTFNTTK